uniref:Uncharacterized protein n=1 Tax=Octactis speculum TaxID=3111310 RepID=A0A7S2H8H7_9STRA|mmetsp:Transcript_62374/g.85738  ORF Transcript_62374/g.85738 Transcript_62374/m.85738 type:complete len:102 (+) Transcript_62374:182-487(+)
MTSHGSAVSSLFGERGEIPLNHQQTAEKGFFLPRASSAFSFFFIPLSPRGVGGMIKLPHYLPFPNPSPPILPKPTIGMGDKKSRSNTSKDGGGDRMIMIGF